MDELMLIEANPRGAIWDYPFDDPEEDGDDDDDPININIKKKGGRDMEYLESRSNPDAAEAMSLAAEYREGGDDPSTALIKAWQDVKGEDNPDDLMESLQSPWVLVLLASGIFTAIWKWRKGEWWWQSIDLTGEKKRAVLETQRIMAIARARARQQSQGAVTLTRQPQLIVQQARNSEQETVALIVP